MESAEKAAARKRMRLRRNGTILTKTMVVMVHMSTVYATARTVLVSPSPVTADQRATLARYATG